MLGMWTRPFWQQAIEEALSRKPVLWLAGVRRVGKTTLCRSLPDSEYFDCELPRTRRTLGDPENFLTGLGNRRIILDEVHRLDDPSELLKIAADHFPDVRVVATGSSVLGASTKFRDTLAGRKETLWLTPMIDADLHASGIRDLDRRLANGGLPPYFLATTPVEREFQEWVDAYWAKDIQEMFRLGRRQGFQRLLELALANSGGIFEATRFAGACEISRPTVTNYLAVLEQTLVVHVVRPYSTRKATEIVSAPKVYGFDTGFVCAAKGWHPFRPDDRGLLWEHYVLNELHGGLQTRRILYWRDKQGHEVDFILPGRGRTPTAIECKWSADRFDEANLAIFRRKYPQGRNLVVAADIDRPYRQVRDGLEVEFVGIADLATTV